MCGDVNEIGLLCFAVDGKKRLKQRDKRKLTSLFLHSSLMRFLTRAPLCSLFFLLLCISMPPPSHLPLKSLHSVSPSLPLLLQTCFEFA